MVASKTDCEDAEEVPVKKALDFTDKIKANLYQTSSRTGTGIKDLFESIAARLLLKTMQHKESTLISERRASSL